MNKNKLTTNCFTWLACSIIAPCAFANISTSGPTQIQYSLNSETNTDCSNSILRLNTGWNLISFPYDPAETPYQLLQQIPGSVSLLSYRDGIWYSSHRQSETIAVHPVTDIEPGRGYWLQMESNINYESNAGGSVWNGETPSLTEGWNIIGVKHEQSAKELLLTVGSESVWGWQDSSWKIHVDHVPTWLNTLQTIHCGQGVYIYSEDEHSPLTWNEEPNHVWTYNGHAYGLFKRSHTWEDANVFAADAGGYLAKIDSAEENENIFTEVIAALSSADFNTTFAIDGGNAAYVWLGATDIQTEGGWVWSVDDSTLESTRAEWGEGASGHEPDNYNNQDYLALGLENWPLGSADDAGYGNAGSWNDLGGDNSLYFVVEREVVSNSPPTGGVQIIGDAIQGDTLTATNDLSDLDGIGIIIYQWQAGGIDFYTGSDLVLTQEHVGRAITAIASYQDGAGNNESVSSIATAVVVNVNDIHSGEVKILGLAHVGEELTIDTSSIEDIDGIGTLNYQWYKDRVAIADATNKSYTLSTDDIGSILYAEVSYTDYGNTFEILNSAITSTVERLKVRDEFPVNTYTHGRQGSPSVAALSDGGFVVTWYSGYQDGSGYGVYGQRYDQAGNSAGDEFPVNTYTDDSQFTPSVAALSDGGFVVTWTSREHNGAGSSVYGQRYDQEGNSVGDEFPVNTYTDSLQSSPSVAALSDGGFVVTWQSSGQDGSSYGVYGQRYDQAGNSVGDEFQVNTYTDRSQDSPSVVALSDGGFVVTWQSGDQDGSSYGVYGQLFLTSDVTLNNPSSGTVSIAGTIAENEVLTASNTLADVDELGTISYEWHGSSDNGVTWTPISSGESLTLTEDEVGQHIKVVASYTDGEGTAESIESSATAVVTGTSTELSDSLPELLEFSLTDTVDLSSQSYIDISTRFIDGDSDLSGFTVAFDKELPFSGGPSNQFSVDVSIFSAVPGYDMRDINSLYKAGLDTTDDIAGTYTVTQVEIDDSLGNTLRLTTDDLSALGYDTSFEIVGGAISASLP